MKERWKKKTEYFWMYYKIPFLILLGLAVMICYFGYAKLTEKEIAFQALLFDVHTDVSEEKLEKDFAEYAGIDREKEEVFIHPLFLLADGTSNYAMTSQSKFYTLIGTEDLDVSMMLEENFANFAKADAFLDLTTVFSEEELEAFPSFYKNEEGVIIGIYVNDLKGIQEIGGYSGEDKQAIAGIVYNSRHVDTAKEYLLYLLKQSIVFKKEDIK